MKKILITISLIILLGLGIFLLNKKEDLLQTNNILAIYIKQEDGNYEKTNTIPESGYMLNEDRSVCTNNAQPNWNINTNSLKINNLRSNNTNCYLYFDSLAKTKILANKTLTNRPEINGPLTTDGNDVYYEALDDDGLSQYFAGVVDNNWVRFAGYYWRIVRINGDGTIRIIYNGPTTNQTGETTQIGVSAFNENYDDNAYVGYMYGTPNSNTYEETHANINDSTIKKVLDKWYQNSLQAYADKIDFNAGFCNDREILYKSGSGEFSNLGYKKENSSYISAHKVITNNEFGIEQYPYLKCNDNDLFTYLNANKGNKNLTYPIGLVTLDEVLFAGGFAGTISSGFWLYTSNAYWTMSPSFYKGDHSFNFAIYSDGNVNNSYIHGEIGVRPVINLKSNLILNGDGSKNNPFTIS